MAVVEFLILLTLDGRGVHVRADQILSMVEARMENDPKKRWHDRVRCIVTLADGSHISVVEECPNIERRLQEAIQRQYLEMDKGPP